ncbi:hypothetical protein V8C43DRAFT_279846 [Trichoderma afarasin]
MQQSSAAIVSPCSLVCIMARMLPRAAFVSTLSAILVCGLSAALRLYRPLRFVSLSMRLRRCRKSFDRTLWHQ